MALEGEASTRKADDYRIFPIVSTRLIKEAFNLAQCRRREAFIQRFQHLTRIDPAFVHASVSALHLAPALTF